MTAALEGGEWSAARPGRTLHPGKKRYPFYRRLGGPQGRPGRAKKSRPHRDSIQDRPARSQSVIYYTEIKEGAKLFRQGIKIYSPSTSKHAIK